MGFRSFAGWWGFISFVVFVAAWLLAGWGAQECPCWPLKPWATALGVGGYYLFAISLLLSSRWKVLEDWIGGLDQIYHLHRKAGILGFCLIFVHPWVEALKWLPQRMDKFWVFIFPIHGRLSVNLGSYAFWLAVVVLGITFLKLLPYDKWKIVHKLMTLVFILASLHIVTSDKRVGTELAQSLLYIPMAIGFFGILYKQVYLPLFAKKVLLNVVGARLINDNVVEVTLEEKEGGLHYRPGQYGFFSFNGPGISSESHPFTLIGGKRTSILVKARGDFTKEFYLQVRVGNEAVFEGPYGRFDYTKAGSAQIWIAGGIGIAPFLAWIRAAAEHGLEGKREVDFYYCVHRKVDAVFYEEFQAFSSGHPDFRCFLCCSEEGTRINPCALMEISGGVKGRHVLMCGPLRLTKDLTARLQALGLSRSEIWFEDFEFF